MEKDQIVILEDRGLISVSGPDVKNFLQNIISNDIEIVNDSNSIFTGIFTPQGKYLYEFFVISYKGGYLLECNNELKEEIIKHLFKYKLRSKIEINDFSSNYVVGIINLEKFQEIQADAGSSSATTLYRESPCFLDPRLNTLGARMISSLENLYLTIKKLNLNIVSKDIYLKIAHKSGIPIQEVKNLQNALFSLESNFEELNGISFRKGCYVGQENTARMKLKNKIRKRLLPINFEKNLPVLSEILYENNSIGKIIISKPYPFALVNLFNPEFNSFKNKELKVKNTDIKIIIPNWINL